MPDLGRMLVSLGILLVVLGLILMAFTRMNVPMGRLPGDLSWHGRGWSVSFPIVSSIVVSVVLSFIFWLINHFRR